MAVLCFDPVQRLALGDDPDFGDEDALVEMAPRGCGPVRLREWGTYYLKWHADPPAGLAQLPTSPFAGPQKWEGQIREINFNNYVGLARIGPFHVHVENKKIGDELFHALLDNVAGHYADLIFGFAQDPVGHAYQRGADTGRNLAYVEYLFLRKYLLSEDIEGIVAAILRNPHITLLRETRSVPLGMARALDPVALVDSLCRGDHLALLGPGHGLSATPLGRLLAGRTGRLLFPAEVPEERRYHTYDTHENRFAKHVLEDLVRRLDEVSSTVAQHGGSLVNPEIRFDLERLRRKVDGCLDDPFWRDVGLLRFVPQGSPVLQRREGYRQLYQLHALLQLLTRYDYGLFDFEYLLETKDTATLYEYWCFFQVKTVLDGQYGQAQAEPLVTPSDTRAQVIQGARLRYEGGPTLSFNWTADGSTALASVTPVASARQWQASYAGEFRPDITIEIPGRRLILDAKNKGRRRNGLFGAQDDGTIQTPNPGDLTKMHAYRDAIAETVGAFALYPGRETCLYPAHGASGSWEGIGALALRPNMSGKPDREGFRDLQALLEGFLGNWVP